MKNIVLIAGFGFFGIGQGFSLMAPGEPVSGKRYYSPATKFEDGSGYGYAARRFYVSTGVGAVNLNRIVANQIKNSINTRWAEIDVKGSPIWFGRAEYAIHRHHSAAVDFAYSGFRLQVALPDSLTKLNIPVKGELRYRTWSLLARYNFHIFPENRFDMYVGLGMGYRANNFKVADNDEEKDWWNFPIDLKWVTKMIPTSLSVPTVGADFTLGFRYFVLPPVALYAEFGVAKSIAQFGIVGRF